MANGEQVNASNESEQARRVQQSFGPTASAYVTSSVHALGIDLQWLVEAAGLKGDEIVVDIATGGGHAAFALAPYAGEVVAVDITESMLEVAQAEASKRGLHNIRYLRANTEDLPLAAGSVDLVACRMAAHHFEHAERAVNEWARVLRPAGRAVLIDTMGPEEPRLDEFFHEIEVLRDPSHARNLRASRWIALFQSEGLSAQIVRTWDVKLDLPSWTQRMRTPADKVARIVQLFSEADAETKARFNIEPHDGSFTFTIPACVLVANK